VGIVDLQTNRRYWIRDTFGLFWWITGNGCCDCNRSLAVGHGDYSCNVEVDNRYELLGSSRLKPDKKL